MNASQEQPEQQKRPKGSYFSHPSPEMPAYVYVGAGGNKGEVYVVFYAQQDNADEVRVMADPGEAFCKTTPPVGGTALTQDPNEPDMWTGCVPDVPCNSEGTAEFELGAREKYPINQWAPCHHETGFLGECADGDCSSKG